MSTREVRLPEPPRRVVAGEGGELVFEFEPAIAQLRIDSTAFELRAVPEQPGELLIAPRGRDECVMLGPSGTLKVYAGRKLLYTRPSALEPDDELIDARVSRDGGLVVLVGARVGEEFLLPVPQYRFVPFGPTLERAGPDASPMDRRPSSWNLDDRSGALIALVSTEDGAEVRAITMRERSAVSLHLPADIADTRLTGLAVERASGNILLTGLVQETSELRVWSPRAGRHVRLAAVRSPEELTDPLWSPDGTRLAFKRSSGGRNDLLALHPASNTTQTVCELGAGAQVLWADATTIAVVDWDDLDWYRI